ncbi:MAG: hypothetical protein A2705_03595 [Omnitrophica WOR_2 bacterium RIFCSPHIGHO2_01_FULL_52_10]|nr:MAG: hypothetical protein A2705_03595 [Omnitrophica WOR_2 bacterium RIFCSPHIGHO2_01_FULL_52_10]
MRKAVPFFVFILLVSGCATAPARRPPGPKVRLPGTVVFTEQEPSGGLENIGSKDMREYVRRRGVVFAKTDFQGVLQATYVRLRIAGEGKYTHSFYLDIEGKPEENSLSGSGKMVKPGYFFIELPAGSYRISSIAIPVGSTLAEEDISISFEVLPNAVVYMGTLKVVGTGERVKLGGVPVIKPGFDYETAVFDERREGIYAFHKRYPDIPVEIETRLMRVNR